MGWRRDARECELCILTASECDLQIIDVYIVIPWRRKQGFTPDLDASCGGACVKWQLRVVHIEEGDDDIALDPAQVAHPLMNRAETCTRSSSVSRFRPPSCVAGWCCPATCSSLAASSMPGSRWQATAPRRTRPAPRGPRCRLAPDLLVGVLNIGNWSPPAGRGVHGLGGSDVRRLADRMLQGTAGDVALEINSKSIGDGGPGCKDLMTLLKKTTLQFFDFEDCMSRRFR